MGWYGGSGGSSLTAAQGLKWFNVIDYGAKGDGTTDDYAAVNSAISAIITNKGGVLFFPYMPAGYVLGTSVVIDPTLIAAYAVITVELDGNSIYPNHTGWCFDVKSNYFGVNSGYTKFVSFYGSGGSIWTNNTAAAGGIRFSDFYNAVVEDMLIGNYAAGDGIQFYISSTTQTTYTENNYVSNVGLYGNLNGLHCKCNNPSTATAGSFLGGYYEKIHVNGTVNNAKLFNLEGWHTNSVFERCGGWYNQSSSTGGNGFYLNGTFQGCTFISPWIDNAGTQAVATDIVIGTNYTANATQFPTIVNSMWISLPANWRSYLHVLGPYFTLGPSGTGTVLTADTREVLSANRTYYVATTGSDSNTGLVSGTPFRNMSKAMAVIATLDFNGYTVTVQLADGSYTETVTVPTTVGQSSLNNFIIQGNTTTPGNVIVTGAGGAYQGTFNVTGGARCQILSMRINGYATNGYGISVGIGSALNWGGLVFGACTQAQVYCQQGSVATCFSAYTIAGGSPEHIAAVANGAVQVQTTVTLTGTPAFSTGFVWTTIGGAIQINGCTFTGSATGPRYATDTNGVIQTFGSGASYLPGNAAGTIATGGQYA